VEFYDKGEFENARAAFLQAYALHKHPAVLINLAQSSLRSGHTLDADRYFTRYLLESPSLTAAQRAEAEKGLAEARTKLGRIDVLAPPGTAVTIDTEIAGTDGSTTLDVEPGSHTVKGAGETNTVAVTAGQTVMVKIGAGGAAPAPIAPAPTPAAETPPAPPAETAAPEPPPPPAEPAKPGLFSPPATMVPVWVGAGVSFAGFATAIIFGVFKSNALDQFNTEQSDIVASLHGAKPNGQCVNPTSTSLQSGCNALSSDANDVSNDATVANIGIVTGIVGAAFAGGWYLFAPKRESPKGVPAALQKIHPLIGPHLSGLAIGSSF
jgi:hypothetical protein